MHALVTRAQARLRPTSVTAQSRNFVQLEHKSLLPVAKSRLKRSRVGRLSLAVQLGRYMIGETQQNILLDTC